MSLLRRLLVAALLVLLAAGAEAQLQSFDKSALTIDSGKGPQRFTVELALTPAQQEQGLMFRRSMPENAGMLFIFPASAPQIFWMHNTLIPLDMLFVAADGHIADIHERAVPMTDATIASKVPVLAVLELNGGTVNRLGIKPGDIVHHPAFGTAPSG